MAAEWRELTRGDNAARSAVVAGGMVLHAVNVFIVATILPSVVAEIGGLRLFAWSTTLYVVASLIGGVGCARLMHRVGTRWTYRAALIVFALGCVVCALAPSMPVLLAGRLVQGLGAGTLSALSFTQIRLLFPERLWPRAIAIVSVMWASRRCSDRRSAAPSRKSGRGAPRSGACWRPHRAWRCWSSACCRARRRVRPGRARRSAGPISAC